MVGEVKEEVSIYPEQGDDSAIVVDDNDDIGADIASAIEEVESTTEESGEPADDTPETEAETEVEEEAPVQEAEAAERVGQPEPEVSDVLPPGSMNTEEKQQFYKLPAEAQRLAADFCKRRDLNVQQHLTQQTQQISKARKVYAELDEAFAPYVEGFRRDGKQPAEVVGRLLAWESYLDDAPVAAILDLAGRYNVTPEHLMGHIKHGGMPQQQNDPRMDEAIQRIEAQAAEIEELRNGRQQAVVDAGAQDWQAFALAADESGQPLYPYANDLAPQMVQIIQQIRSQDGVSPNQQVLKQAYDQAVWANPETRKIMLSKQNGKQVTAKKQQAAQAKKAATSVVGSAEVGSIKDGELPETIDEAILRAMGEL